MEKRLNGLIAATFTPMHEDGSLNLTPIPAMVEHLLTHGIAGLYVVGSTGEGVSLTNDERRKAAEAFVQAAGGRMAVVVQVGHNSLFEARQLAAHAQGIGATAISATPPSYFKPDTPETLAACMAEIAAGASETPFYYYHVPHMTNVGLSMLGFLKAASECMPTLAGIKYTAPTMQELLACIEAFDGKFEILHGVDEMLLSGLASGATGAVGSTYNYAAPIYRHMIRAFSQGNLDEARLWQSRSCEMVRVILQYRSLASQKAVMAMIGLDCGPTRLPIPSLTEQECTALRDKLAAMGFFDWIGTATAADEDAYERPLRWSRQ